MTDFQIAVTLVVFAVVILAIAADAIDMMLAALRGSSVLAAFGILGKDDVGAAMETAGGPLALLFGGMVVARMLAMTGIFARVGALFLRASRGSGRRYLILLVALVAPVCALLPNATTVILLAPVIVGVALCTAMPPPLPKLALITLNAMVQPSMTGAQLVRMKMPAPDGAVL